MGTSGRVFGHRGGPSKEVVLDEAGRGDYKEGVTDYYEILGVSRRATTEEITSAYKAVVMRYHPDQHEQNALKELAQEKLKQANEAYETLKSPQRRRLYDAGMTTPYQAHGSPAAVQVSPRSLTRMALVTAGWLIAIPLMVRLSHSPRVFWGILAGVFVWRMWRRRRLTK